MLSQRVAICCLPSLCACLFMAMPQLPHGPAPPRERQEPRVTARGSAKTAGERHYSLLGSQGSRKGPVTISRDSNIQPIPGPRVIGYPGGERGGGRDERSPVPTLRLCARGAKAAHLPWSLGVGTRHGAGCQGSVLVNNSNRLGYD